MQSTDPTFEELIERARGIHMTDAEREAQRRSFAYGNLKLANPSVTRALINKAAEKLAKKRSA